MAGTKTIAVTEAVWERLKEIMKREHAGSMNQVVEKLVEKAARVPPSRFGAHKRLKVTLTQKEHEDITAEMH